MDVQPLGLVLVIGVVTYLGMFYIYIKLREAESSAHQYRHEVRDLRREIAQLNAVLVEALKLLRQKDES